MDTVLLVSMVAGAWVFTVTALLIWTRGATKKRTPKPSQDIEVQLRALERDVEGLHGDYMKLNQKVNRMRQEERREQERAIPQNGTGDQRELDQDPRFASYFD